MKIVIFVYVSDLFYIPSYCDKLKIIKLHDSIWVDFVVAQCEKVTLQAHLYGAFCVVTQSRWNPIAPSFHHKNHSEICDLSVNKYWGTGSYIIDEECCNFAK